MRIDLHVHTSKSLCSNLTLEKIVKKAIEKGISCVAICDHDVLFDECEISSVKERLEKELSIVINPEKRCQNEFYIIPGIEISTPSGHVLKLFFKKNKDFEITILAHPFEHREYSVDFVKEDYDLIETASARACYKRKSANNDAKRLAESLGLLVSAGSDAHFEDEIGNAYIEISDDFEGLEGLGKCILYSKRITFNKNSKRVFIAKSQILKNRRLKTMSIKTYIFYLYCAMRDFGDVICRK